jgi:lambda family phage portal protein
MGIIDRITRALSAPGPQLPQVSTGRPMAGADYMRGNLSPIMFGWRPQLRDPRVDVMRSWVDATARTIDALHNSGVLAGGVDQAVSNTIGTGLRLNAQPDPAIFGGQAAANTWARQVERRWNDYANDAWSVDLGGRYTLGQMLAQGFRSYLTSGEILATMPWLERPGSTHGTKVNLLPSNRLSQGGIDRSVVQGVRMDANGAPVGYIFTNPDPLTGVVRDIEVAGRDPLGRKLVIHVFDGAPTATRGITPLAPALQVLRQIDQLQNATLTAALIQAIFAASIESDAPTEEVMEALRSEDEQSDPAPADPNAPPRPETGLWDAFMGKRFQWYGKSSVDLGQFGKVFHAFPGEKLEFHTPQHPGTNYKDFIRMLFREVARCLGVTYEQLTLDNEGATYSSLNNETADIFQISLYRRTHIAAPVMQSVYVAWLEEEIERGLTKFPGGIEAFHAQRVQATRAAWQGPPRPPADEKKTAEANEVKLRNKVMTRASWCADEGTDWQDVDEQEAQEQENRERLNLPPVTPVTNTTPNLPQGGRTGDKPEPGSSEAEEPTEEPPADG